MYHDSRRRFPSLRETETAVADPPARRAHPGLVEQNLPDVFSVAVQETGAADLTTDTATVQVVTDGFGVGRFLPALVASGPVCPIVDLVGCFYGDFGDFPLLADWFSVQFDFHWVFLAVSPLSGGERERGRVRERRGGGGGGGGGRGSEREREGDRERVVLVVPILENLHTPYTMQRRDQQ